MSPADLLGVGVLAMTVDQGEYTQRYQGIVQLEGQSLDEVARTYFRQSEQIPTDVRLAVARHVVPGEGGADERWRAGGMLIQFLPDSPERLRLPDLPGGDGHEGHEHDPTDDAWAEATALLATVEPDELLFRLFHEHGVRVFEGGEVADRCSCSREKIRAILDGFTAEEIEQSVEDGEIRVSCEFCSKTYRFAQGELV